MLVLQLVGFAVLVVATGVFVAAEFALVSLPRPEVDRAAAQGVRGAGSVQRAQRRLGLQLSVSQFGITVTSLAVGVLAEPAVAAGGRPFLGWLGEAAEPVAVGLALLLATFLSMLLGELVPKNLALAAPLATARVVVPLQAAFAVVTRPVVAVLDGAANRLVRAMGVEPVEESAAGRGPVELRRLVRRSALAGALPQATAHLLSRTLTFGDTRAGDVMTARPQVVALRADETAADLLLAAARTGHSRFPVHAGSLDEVVGVAHVSQALAVPTAERATTSLRHLARPPLRLPDTLPAADVLGQLRRAKARLAVVVDEYGGTAGIVTVEDVVEEIVGEVRDEHDDARAERRVVRAGSDWLLDGLLRPDEVLEATGVPVPEGVWDTLGGYVMTTLGKMPEVGDRVELDGSGHSAWVLTVTALDGRRTARVRARAVAHRHAQQVPA